MQWAWTLLICFLELLVEATLALRVFAMYGLNKWVLACLLCANVAIAVSALFASIEYGKHPDLIAVPGFSGCNSVYTSRSEAARDRSLIFCPLPAITNILGPAVVWEAILVCDILVFGLTIRQALVHRKTVSQYSGSLIERMATDGTMYFGIIVLANLANVSTFYFGDAILIGFLSWFNTSLSLTLISRLILNLHEAADARTMINTGTLTFTLNTRDPETLQFVTEPTT
ncbi:hypothetical protein C8R45DRAFT_200320 [Mycena sanguinolenta]|nr:hypothetical protein C8R45DRAFT_200320 [Mycena sanguinolenta]